MFLCTFHIQSLANNRFAIVMCQDSEKTSNLDEYFTYRFTVLLRIWISCSIPWHISFLIGSNLKVCMYISHEESRTNGDSKAKEDSSAHDYLECKYFWGQHNVMTEAISIFSEELLFSSLTSRNVRVLNYNCQLPWNNHSEMSTCRHLQVLSILKLTCTFLIL